MVCAHPSIHGDGLRIARTPRLLMMQVPYSRAGIIRCVPLSDSHVSLSVMLLWRKPGEKEKPLGVVQVIVSERRKSKKYDPCCVGVVSVLFKSHSCGKLARHFCDRRLFVIFAVQVAKPAMPIPRPTGVSTSSGPSNPAPSPKKEPSSMAPSFPSGLLKG